MGLKIEGFVPLLTVFDMPTSLAFYRDVLGFEIVGSSESGDDFDWGLLRLDSIELMLNTAHERHDRPPAPDPARRAIHLDTALFFGCRDLDAAYEHFRAHGVELKPPVVRAYGMKQLWVRDPDGYNLCFQWEAA